MDSRRKENVKRFLSYWNPEAVAELLSDVEPEYYYTEEDIKTLLQVGSLAQFQDCLEFAPEGTINLVKKLAVELRLNDVSKREALLKATGFNVTNAIAAIDAELEDGHSKKVTARHNEKKKNIEKRFYDNMNYKHSHTNEKGNKHGRVKRGDGPEVPITIHKKGLDAYSNYVSGIHMGRRVTRMKGSDLTGSHEYSHQKDDDKIRKRGTYSSEVDSLLSSKPSFKKFISYIKNL